MLTMTPAEGNQAMCVLALDPERLIIASTEKLRKLPTGSQDTADEPLLDPAIGPAPQQLGRIRTGAQAGHPRGVIHRATVIRVDHAEIPVLTALIEVRHPGAGHAQHALGQTVQCAVAAGELDRMRSEEHTSELQSRPHLVCRLL